MEILKVNVLACLAIIGLLSCGVKAQNCTDISAIDDVQLFELGGQLVVVWQEPENMNECGFDDIVHTVQYSGYETVQEIETSEYYAYFDYAPYRCVPGVVTISAYNDVVSTSVTVEYYTETSEVEGLTVSQDTPGTIVASWIEPEDSEYCDFIYVVSYEDDNSNTVTVETSDLQAALDSVTLSSCVQATVTVTPVNGNYVGVAAAAETEGDINPVRNYALSEDNTDVIARFDPPVNIEFCNVTYEVREHEQDCYTKIVSVAAYNGRIYSPWVSDTIEVPIGSLSNVGVAIDDDSVVVSWSAPSDASACGVTYQVVFDGETYTTEDASLTLLATVIQACAITTVSVSPVSSSGQVGSASELHIQGELLPIQNLALAVEDDTLVASWDTPPNSSSCVLSYLLEYTDGSGTHIYVTSDNTYSLEYTSCVDVTVTVSAYAEDGSESPGTSLVLEAAC